MGIAITKYAQNGYNLSFISGQGEAHGHAVGLSFIDFSFGAPPATQPVQRILQAEVGSIEDQPRHVDIVLFRRLLGRMIAPDAALIDGGRSVLFGTFLPVYPKIQFDGSAMALRTKAVISSPSRSTLRSMSASIRFHRNCRKKPT